MLARVHLSYTRKHAEEALKAGGDDLSRRDREKILLLVEEVGKIRARLVNEEGDE